MDLAAYRKSRGLSQAQVAVELGLSGKSYVSMLERRSRPVPVALALRIQRWSEGTVKATTLRPDDEDLRQAATQGAA